MASITCRKGETFPATHRHASVAEVRKCQGAPSSWKPVVIDNRPAGSQIVQPETPAKDPKGAPAQLANLPQLEQPSENWLRKARVDAEVRGDSAEANKITSQLAALGREVTARHRNPVDPELEAKVPDGRYAIERDGAVKFYRVRKVTTGRWAGRTFVNIQAGDDEFPVRFAAERAKILAAIGADVKAAAIRYGRELGKCSQCNRTLTNPESIALGIGPICLNKIG